MTTVTTESGYQRESDDWYVEPEWCVEYLLKAEFFSGLCLDPAAGLGTIPRVCKRFGLEAYGYDQEPKAPDVIRCEFLETDWDEIGPVDNIICNPPYSLAVPFIGKALEVAQNKVAMLLPVSFLSSQTRNVLFNNWPVSRVYVLSRRPSMPPGRMLVRDGESIRGGGKKDFMWMVFHQGHRGPPTLEWLI